MFMLSQLTMKHITFCQFPVFCKMSDFITSKLGFKLFYGAIFSGYSFGKLIFGRLFRTVCQLDIDFNSVGIIP